MKILICGKGGSGKSTVAALLAMNMNKKGKAVLLVDADESNIGLYRMLGLDAPQSLMDYLGGKKGFREKTKAASAGLGSSSSIFPETLTPADLPPECVAVSKDIRVMSLGKIHHFGEGCACPMGSLFRQLFLSLRVGPQDVVIVDTSAGVEHFGRSLDGLCDHILCVAEPSYESVMLVRRVIALAEEAHVEVSVLLNKMTPEIEADIRGALEGCKITGSLPDSRSIFMKNLKGEALGPDQEGMDFVFDMLKKRYP